MGHIHKLHMIHISYLSLIDRKKNVQNQFLSKILTPSEGKGVLPGVFSDRNTSECSAHWITWQSFWKQTQENPAAFSREEQQRTDEASM